MNKYMQMAIREAKTGIEAKHGGPFGCVIVKNGKVVGQGHNQVILNNDPTCHGEMMAIKNACHHLNTYDLTGCDLYTTGEPCLMCLCACLWANIRRVYYGATINDNGLLGFRDKQFDQLFNGREKLSNYLVMVDREEVLKLFTLYNQDKKIY